MLNSSADNSLFGTDILTMKHVKLVNLFDVIDTDNIEPTLEENNSYPLIGNSPHNNMIIQFLPGYTLNGDYICIGNCSPTLGMCSVHHGKFSTLQGIVVLHLKPKFERLTNYLNCLAGCLSHYLHITYLTVNEFEMFVKYGHDYNWFKKAIESENIPNIPFTQSTDNPYKMIIDTEGLKYVFNFWSPGCDDKDKWYNPVCVGNKTFKLDDFLNHAGTGKIKSIGKEKEGIYPCISGTINNNGIYKYIDHYDLDGTYLTIPSVSDIFKCYVQCGKFSARSSVNILELKPEYKHLESCLTLIAYIITIYIEKAGYSYHGKNLLKSFLMSEPITLPVVVRGLTSEQEQQISNKEITIEQLTNNFTSEQFTYELNENLMNWFCWKWFI